MIPLAVVTEVSVVLSAKIGEFASGMQKAMLEVDRFAKNTRSLGDSVMRTGMDMAKYISAPVGAAVTGLVLFMKKTAQAAGDLNAMAQKMGMSNKALQELRYIASQTDVSFDNLTVAAGQLGRRMVDGSEDSKELAAIIKGLKIDTKDATGQFLSMDVLLPQVISRLSEMQDVTKRNSLALQLFGKGGYELIPMLNKSTAEIERLRQRAHELGLVLDDKTIAALKRVADRMEEFKLVVSVAAARIGDALVPAFDKLIPLVQTQAIPLFERAAHAVRDLATAFAALPEGTQKAILAITGIVSVLAIPVIVIAGLIKAFGIIAGGIAGLGGFLAGFVAVLGKVVFAISAVAGGAATLGEGLLYVMGPVGLMIAGILTLIGITAKYAAEQEKHRKTIGEVVFASEQLKKAEDELAQAIAARDRIVQESTGNNKEQIDTLWEYRDASNAVAKALKDVAAAEEALLKVRALGSIRGMDAELNTELDRLKRLQQGMKSAGGGYTAPGLGPTWTAFDAWQARIKHLEAELQLYDSAVMGTAGKQALLQRAIDLTQIEVSRLEKAWKSAGGETGKMTEALAAITAQYDEARLKLKELKEEITGGMGGLMFYITAPLRGAYYLLESMGMKLTGKKAQFDRPSIVESSQTSATITRRYDINVNVTGSGAAYLQEREVKSVVLPTIAREIDDEHRRMPAQRSIIPLIA